MCEILINQKMQMNKKYIMQANFSKNSPVFSSTKMKKRISSSDKKHRIAGTPSDQ
jgi:hypothetical protein